MALALLALAASFVLLFLAARRVEAAGKAGMTWMMGAYFFQTVGELTLSPVGLSMVTKLAPRRFASALMGVWFLSNAAGNKLAGSIGALAEGQGDAAVFLGHRHRLRGGRERSSSPSARCFTGWRTGQRTRRRSPDPSWTPRRRDGRSPRVGRRR